MIKHMITFQHSNVNHSVGWTRVGRTLSGNQIGEKRDPPVPFRKTFSKKDGVKVGGYKRRKAVSAFSLSPYIPTFSSTLQFRA